MTQGEFDRYLLFVAVFAGALGVVNLLRPHKRWLGAGAILLGLGALLYAQRSPAYIVALALAAGCMIRDVGARVGKPRWERRS